jgi:DNA processing protein
MDKAMSMVLTDEQVEQAIYLYALGTLRGLGPKSILKIARAFPQVQYIPELSQEELAATLGNSLAEKLAAGFQSAWQEHVHNAQRAIQHHLDKGIVPLPITSQDYPVLLKLIKDPPPLLYIKGDSSVLNQRTTLAIIGTREATARGLHTARTIASEAARHGCVIVSGLAKGIDTAAHQGAIEAGGKTIAVLATPLDKVYPAENKQLADIISTQAGVLVSEYALGIGTTKGAFVARDRLQSGLSLGVFPIQTGIDGGTMHTIRFAREQKRPLFYSPPPEEERKHEKYRGIVYLMQEAEKEKHIDKKKRAINPFPLNRPGIYERLAERLEEQRSVLLATHPISSQPTPVRLQPLPTMPIAALPSSNTSVVPSATSPSAQGEASPASSIDTATIVTATPAPITEMDAVAPHCAETIDTPAPSERIPGAEEPSGTSTESAKQKAEEAPAPVSCEKLHREHDEGDQEILQSVESQQINPTETPSLPTQLPQLPQRHATHRRKRIPEVPETQKDELTDSLGKQTTVHLAAKKAPIAKSASSKRRSSGNKPKKSNAPQGHPVPPEARQSEIGWPYPTE